MENMENKLAELEALLFIHGEPLTEKKAAKVLEVSADDLEAALAELEKRLADEGRGLTLVRDSGKMQLVTKPQFSNILENFIKEELSEELTPASLEVLSIVAYLSPISRSEIDYRRGVNSSFTVRNLALRGLIERFTDPERPSLFFYRPTFEFLRHLGVKNREELPDYEKFRAALSVPEAAEQKMQAKQENT